MEVQHPNGGEVPQTPVPVEPVLNGVLPQDVVNVVLVENGANTSKEIAKPKARKRPRAPVAAVEQNPTLSAGSKRIRVKTSRHQETDSYEEMQQVQRALDNSRYHQYNHVVDRDSLPEAPTLYPTLQEFADPVEYVASIKPMGQKYGIVKIVPPEGWSPPHVDMGASMAGRTFPTKLQSLHKMQQGKAYGDGKDYTVEDFKTMAEAFATNWMREHPDIAEETDKRDRQSLLEAQYWRLIDTASTQIQVEYGNDLDVMDYCSGFPEPPQAARDGHLGEDRTQSTDFTKPDYYETSGWNLNNLPRWPTSALRFFRCPISGVTRPWLYVAMQFSTFAWHNEDNYLFSMNYSHKGDTKQWYGVPGHQAKDFEDKIKRHLHSAVREDPDLLYDITTMMNPVLLKSRGLTVHRVMQDPGEFVVTFPKSYHAGFSYGYNVGEAVNFATPDWIEHGSKSNEIYRKSARPSVFSFDRVVFTMAMYLPEHSVAGCRLLLAELKRLQFEEIANRNHALESGIPYLSEGLPQFKLHCIEEDALNYDDKRMCKFCKHTCFMSAVVCRCDNESVACLRHWKHLCKCPEANHLLFIWMSKTDLDRIVKFVSQYVDDRARGVSHTKEQLQGFWDTFDFDGKQQRAAAERLQAQIDHANRERERERIRMWNGMQVHVPPEPHSVPIPADVVSVCVEGPAPVCVAHAEPVCVTDTESTVCVTDTESTISVTDTNGACCAAHTTHTNMTSCTLAGSAGL